MQNKTLTSKRAYTLGIITPHQHKLFSAGHENVVTACRAEGQRIDRCFISDIAILVEVW